MPIDPHELGLSLSGGGYRASAFHLGTMKKLNELKILPHVDILSTISGGSITGAAYCISETSFDEFEKIMKEKITTKSVIKYILTSFDFFKTAIFFLIFIGLSIYSLFTDCAWLSPVFIVIMLVLIVRFQYKIFPVSRIIIKAYNKFFYDDKKLADLSDHKPTIAIGSTNIQTCRPFTFSKKKMGDSSYYSGPGTQYFKVANFQIARAVMASSSVPFAFTPIWISKEFYTDEALFNKKQMPVLVDGGVYDNQGIHKLFQTGDYYCKTIIVSDAGNKIPFQNSYNNVLVLLIRVMDVFMARIKNFQMMQGLYENTKTVNREITYISLGWDVDKCLSGFLDNLEAGNIKGTVIRAHNIPEEWAKEPMKYRTQIQQLLEANVDYKKIWSERLTDAQMKIARSVGTNLSCLSKEQVECLTLQSANITELQVKLYCPTLIQKYASDK